MRPSKAEAERYQLLGYRPIPILPNTKVPSGPGWAKTSPPLLTAEDIRSTAWPGGVGIRCGVGDAHVVGVDVDIDHPVIAQEILRTLRGVYGDVAYRVGAAPRLLVPMRTLEGAPVARGSPKYTLATGETCCIDILGAGKQFVAHGIHPTTGQAYVWRGGLPRAVELPVWTEEVAGQLREALADAVEEFGGAVAGQKKPPADGEGGGGGRICGVSRREVARLMQALYQIPSTDGKTWREVGFALHAEYCGSAEGLHVWIAWSMDYAGPREGGQTCAQECARRWAKMRPDGGVQGGTIYHLAKLHAKLHVAAEEVAAPGAGPLTAPGADSDSVDRGPYPCYTYDEMQSMRHAEEWLIADVLPTSGMGYLFAPSSAGKSFLALDMAMSVARGIPWAGKAVRQKSVAIIVAEGQTGYAKRMEAYLIHNELIAEDFRDLWVVTRAPNFAVDDDWRGVAKSIRIACPAGVGLVVVDTQHAATVGADENSAQDMGRVMTSYRALVGEVGGFLLALHHPGKDVSRGQRGAGAQRDGADRQFKIEEKHGVRTFQSTKDRDGDNDMAFDFTLRKVPLIKDPGSSSCVVVHGVPMIVGGAIVEASSLSVVQRRVVGCWEEGISEAEWIRRAVAMTEGVAPDRCKRQKVRKAIDSLLARGYVTAPGADH